MARFKDDKDTNHGTIKRIKKKRRNVKMARLYKVELLTQRVENRGGDEERLTNPELRIAAIDFCEKKKKSLKGKQLMLCTAYD